MNLYPEALPQTCIDVWEFPDGSRWSAINELRHVERFADGSRWYRVGIPRPPWLASACVVWDTDRNRPAAMDAQLLAAHTYGRWHIRPPARYPRLIRLVHTEDYADELAALLVVLAHRRGGEIRMVWPA